MADLRTGEPQVHGPIAHDANVSGSQYNPLLQGGRARDGLPAAVSADDDAVWQLIDRYGRAGVILDPDTGQPIRVGPYGSVEVGDRNLVMADYLADSIETTRWTVTNANGGTSTSASGEGLLQTSAAASGSTVMQSIEKVRYTPGISYLFGCEARINNSIANNTKRFGLFTGTTTPTDGYYFEFTGATPTINVGASKASTPTVVASGSWARNATNPFTLDANFHRYEILIGGGHVFFIIDGIVRHILTLSVSTPRVTSLILPVTITDVNASAAATNVSMGVTGVWVAKIGDVQDYELPHVVQNKVAQYTTTQTGTALWTPATGKQVIVTSYQIQVGGTTAGTMQLWFGDSGDTTYTRGTDRAIFDGEFAPSATLKPGVVQNSPPHGWKGNADQVLRVTDSAAINPLTVNVWGYEI